MEMHRFLSLLTGKVNPEILASSSLPPLPSHNVADHGTPDRSLMSRKFFSLNPSFPPALRLKTGLRDTEQNLCGPTTGNTSRF